MEQGPNQAGMRPERGPMAQDAGRKMGLGLKWGIALNWRNPCSSLTSYDRADWGFDSLREGPGGMAEWTNATVLKTVIPYGYRGFESHSLRQFYS